MGRAENAVWKGWERNAGERRGRDKKYEWDKEEKKDEDCCLLGCSTV
jgi:hypothetical protein